MHVDHKFDIGVSDSNCSCFVERALASEHETAVKEREELHQQMETYRQLEVEKINRIRAENEKYQNDLEQQIEYQRNIKVKEIEIARKELMKLNVIHFELDIFCLSVRRSSGLSVRVHIESCRVAFRLRVMKNFRAD